MDIRIMTMQTKKKKKIVPEKRNGMISVPQFHPD